MAKKTTKKAVATPKSTPTKAVAKKAVVKATATKATTEKKDVSVTKKEATTKKIAVPAKVAKTAETKVAPVKKAATAAKVSAVKKTGTVGQKSVTPAKTVAPAKPAAAKKTATIAKEANPAKAVAVKKETVKKEEKAPKILANTEKKVPKKAAKKAVVSKMKPIKEIEIVDAIAKKADLRLAKPGTVAVRDLDRGQGRKKSPEEEEEIEEFNPTRTSILKETDTTGPDFRYSEEDLQEFKDIILKRLNVARENLNYYQALMARKDESGTEDTDNRYSSMEDGGGAMEREQLSQLAARQMQFIDHLEKAVVRIENKTYGVCRVTGKLIDKARLKAVPHATLSIEAKTSRR